MNIPYNNMLAYISCLVDSTVFFSFSEWNTQMKNVLKLRNFIILSNNNMYKYNIEKTNY